MAFDFSEPSRPVLLYKNERHPITLTVPIAEIGYARESFDRYSYAVLDLDVEPREPLDRLPDDLARQFARLGRAMPDPNYHCRYIDLATEITERVPFIYALGSFVLESARLIHSITSLRASPMIGLSNLKEYRSDRPDRMDWHTDACRLSMIVYLNRPANPEPDPDFYPWQHNGETLLRVGDGIGTIAIAPQPARLLIFRGCEIEHRALQLEQPSPSTVAVKYILCVPFAVDGEEHDPFKPDTPKGNHP